MPMAAAPMANGPTPGAIAAAEPVVPPQQRGQQHEHHSGGKEPRHRSTPAQVSTMRRRQDTGTVQQSAVTFQTRARHRPLQQERQLLGQRSDVIGGNRAEITEMPRQQVLNLFLVAADQVAARSSGR